MNPKAELKISMYAHFDRTSSAFDCIVSPSTSDPKRAELKELATAKLKLTLRTQSSFILLAKRRQQPSFCK